MTRGFSQKGSGSAAIGHFSPDDRAVILCVRHSSGAGGGADSVLINTVSALDRSRFSPVVAFLRKEEEAPSVHIPRLASLQIPCFDLPGRGIFDLRQFRALASVAREHRIVIMHSNDPKSDVFNLLLRRIVPGIRSVSTLHGWIRRRPRSACYMMIDRWALKRCDAVIAVSQHIASAAEAGGIRGVRVIHNGIDTDAWVPSPRQRGSMEPGNMDLHCRIGFIGRISREKGPLDFAAVAGRMLSVHPYCEFLVAGEGPEQDRMRAIVRQNGMGGRFSFLGPLPQNRLMDLYRSLDLLLLPSYTEGLPMVVLEAFAMALPVVATSVGGVGEVVSHGINGFLAKPGDINALAGYALGIIEDSGLRYSFGEKARKTVEDRFSLRSTVRELEELYREVLGRK